MTKDVHNSHYRRTVAMRRRDSTEVSPLIKYLLFGFNVIFWLVGFAIFGIGIYAWVEKETFTRLSSLSIGVLFDPAFIFLVVGGFVFIIGFCGCVGALRENTMLLVLFSFALGIIFFAELAIGILVYMYKEKVREEVEKNLKSMIELYRDDEDLQDLIDWIQRDWLKCCGVKDPDDWDKNIYFVCNNNWVESCGVPSSCCTVDYLNNRQCGYGIRNQTFNAAAQSTTDLTNYKIYQDGCLKKGEEWLKFHILPVSIVIICLAVLQILGICFSQNLRNDIEMQKAHWYHQ